MWLPAALFAICFGWLWLDAKRGWHGIQLPLLGWVLVILGGGLAIWCALIFRLRGEGTPHPFALKTKHLVTTGPFAFVRNPMMWGIGALLIGLALLLGSLGLWFGFAFFVLFVTRFVPRFEEPDMERRFGQEYRDYCRQVPRWWPWLTNTHSAAHPQLRSRN
jgi:protein-S-isoprenylcysteine O-methyltransferase Ste14